MPWPKPSETAVLTVNGRDFKDFLSVSVRHELYGQPPYLCRFTASEGMPLVKSPVLLQVKPGDHCVVSLGGIHAFTGTVMTRQVYMDAGRHSIELQAGTYSELLTGSVISKTGEWLNKTYPQIASDVLKRFGINLRFEGGPPPDEKMPRISHVPGENALDFLDSLARAQGGSDMGNAFTSNPQGDFVVIRGPSGGEDTLREGEHLLVARELIYNPGAATSRPVIGQHYPTDEKWGPAAFHGPSNFADLQGQSDFSGNQPPNVMLLDFPATKALLEGRSGVEGAWDKTNEITLTLTVQGWMRPSGGLWQRNQSVKVISPALMMKGDEGLRLKSVTFNQDSHSGTTSTLVLCNANASKTRPGIN